MTMAGKKVTIENLAMMIKKGFDDTATKSQVGGLEKRLDKIDARLVKIENIILRHHESQIESLEKRILRLEEASSIS